MAHELEGIAATVQAIVVNDVVGHPHQNGFFEVLDPTRS